MFAFFFLLFAFDGPTYGLNEVHGARITAALAHHNRTYIYYAKSAFDSNIYILDWDTLNSESPKLKEVPKDGRVRTVLHGGLLPMENGLGLVCYVCKCIFHLNLNGDYIETIRLESFLKDLERVTHATHSGNKWLFTWRKDGQEFLSTVNPRDKTEEIVFSYNKGFIFFPNEEGMVGLHAASAKLELFSQKFEKTDTLAVDLSSGKDLSSSLADPILVEGKTYLVLTEKIKNERKQSCVFIQKNTLRKTHIRPLGKSPDNRWYFVRNFDLDGELQILPTQEVEEALAEAPILPLLVP